MVVTQAEEDAIIGRLAAINESDQIVGQSFGVGTGPEPHKR